jgi:hypothetical protein
MKKHLLVALALASGALALPPAAEAATADVIHGGCGYNTDQNATLTGGQNAGIIYDLSVTTTGDTPPLPIDATVTCWITVNGVEAPGTRFSYSGAGVQAGVDRISFARTDGDYVYLCRSVAFADGTTDAQCPPYGEPPFPPQPVSNLLDVTFGLVNDALRLANDAIVSSVDPVVCPVLQKLTGTYGPVTIGADGDVHIPDPIVLFNGVAYDCPPYIDPAQRGAQQ